MQYFLVLLIAFCVSYTSSLVHYLKLEKGKNGCKTEDGQELEVGLFLQDEKTCGAVKCISKEGDALIFYCQLVLPFAACKSKKVSSEMDFPVCCWTCVEEEECDANGKPVVPPPPPQNGK